MYGYQYFRCFRFDLPHLRLNIPGLAILFVKNRNLVSLGVPPLSVAPPRGMQYQLGLDRVK